MRPHLLVARLASPVAAALLVGLVVSMPSSTDAASAKQIPLTCNKGPSGQHYDIVADVTPQVAEGGTITARIAATDSGKISQTGLNHVKDMTYEFALPDGAKVVDGSAKIVPGTGTANVREGARVSVVGNSVVMVLPAHVPEGGNYTPPTFEVKLTATAKAGTTLAFGFRQYKVTANAFLVGDVHAVCDPTPKPYVVATVKVVAEAPPAN